MSKYKLDLSTAPTFKRQLKRLLKKYPSLNKDLAQLQAEVEKDYQQNKCRPCRLRMHNKPSLAGRVWKYDCDSSDISRSAKGCFRVVCVFLEDPTTLYAISIFPRPNNDYVDPKETEGWVKQLRECLANPSSFVEDEDSELQV